MEADYKKITQIINYLVRKDASSSSMPELKVIKLVWAADRYHLRKYARTVSNDKYFAMMNGPVGSMTKDVAEFSNNAFSNLQSDDIFRYLASYIKYSKNNQDAQLSSVNDVDTTELSQTDQEALDFAWKNFGKYDYRTLIQLTHKYPEWQSKQDQLNDICKRVDIDLHDFFKDISQDPTEDPFVVTTPFVTSSQQLFEEYA